MASDIRPWQVVRLDGHTVTVVRNCRTETEADVYALFLDTAAVILNLGGRPPHHYDTRRTPSPGISRFCAYCSTDTTNPDTAEHPDWCPRYRPPASPLHPKWAAKRDTK